MELNARMCAYVVASHIHILHVWFESPDKWITGRQPTADSMPTQFLFICS